jgi:hypothetical protein
MMWNFKWSDAEYRDMSDRKKKLMKENLKTKKIWSPFSQMTKNGKRYQNICLIKFD